LTARIAAPTFCFDTNCPNGLQVLAMPAACLIGLCQVRQYGTLAASRTLFPIMWRSFILPTVTGCAAFALALPASASTCIGTPSNGHIYNAVSLPAQGKNFRPYTPLGHQLGLTFVHATVRDIVVASYGDLEREQPSVEFIYGETGLRHGGPMPPHRTHENGTSVDFMVPVRSPGGRPATLPRSTANRFGYDLEFDGNGRSGELRIDFDAIASHLYRLDQHARKRGAGIARVIFDPGLSRKLFEAPAGPRLRALPFMKTKPWVRHDEHYHVDFAIRCSPGA
jgi:penicillin-insensitive murein endopeptidase